MVCRPISALKHFRKTDGPQIQSSQLQTMLTYTDIITISRCQNSQHNSQITMVQKHWETNQPRNGTNLLT